MKHTDTEQLIETTQTVSQRWVDTPYYNAVERAAQKQWDTMIIPFLKDFPINFSNTLELSVGHGRMTNILLSKANQVTGIDVLQENIDFCSERFSEKPNLRLIKNDGVTLKEVESSSITFGFCFDSMMHFDPDVVRNYLEEFARVLQPGGYAFLHHSNLDKNPEGDFNFKPHARNFMSQNLFRFFAFKAGLKTAKSKIIDWGGGDKFYPNLDCFTLVHKIE